GAFSMVARGLTTNAAAVVPGGSKGGTTRRRLFGQAGAAAGALAVVAACGPGPQAGGSPGATAQSGTPSGPARVQGRLQVVQVLDFHPDHNAFLKQTITNFAAQKNWPLDLSDLQGFLGGSDIYQKLQAQKAAGQPVDLIYHGLSAQRLKLFDLTRDATPLVNAMIEKYGAPYSGARASHLIEGRWVGLPFYSRVEGYWLRQDKLAEAGLDVGRSFERWESAVETLLRVSRPEQNFYGWGMTVNRSGDGEYLVWAVIHSWGGALADQSGQLVTLNTRETVEAVRWLASLYRDEAYRPMLPPGVNAWNDTSNNEAYLAGQIGFTFNAGTLYAKAQLDQNPVAGHTVLVPKPLGPAGNRLQSSSGHSLYFMNGSPNFDAAAELAQHLLTDEVQRELWRISQGYVVPAYQRRWDDPLITEHPVSSTYRQIAFSEPPFPGNSWRGPITEASEAVGGENVITDMMGEILGGKAVEQAVRDAHQRAVGIYQSFGLRGA
ncbi:MAG TPA: extracellular solute-binding protein, partial [Chloroflexota bacterium]|nr:extracellular solute-binding protein [Chloroflexota bacterium]